VQSLQDEERGIHLPEGYVPCSHRWLVDEAREIVGIVRVRHNIDTPSWRRRWGISAMTFHRRNAGVAMGWQAFGRDWPKLGGSD